MLRAISYKMYYRFNNIAHWVSVTSFIKKSDRKCSTKKSDQKNIKIIKISSPTSTESFQFFFLVYRHVQKVHWTNPI